MAAKTVDNLQVVLSAQIDKQVARTLKQWESQNTSAADRAKGAFKRFDDGVGAAHKRLLSFKNVAIAAAIAGFGALVNRMLTGIAAIDDVATKLNISTDALQELRFAANQANISTQTFDMALQRFARRAQEAANGTGEAKDALEEMGIELRDGLGNMRKTEDLLADVADQFANAENETKRLRLAFKLFDSEGVAMINMLEGGSKALNDMRERAQRLGLVLDESAIKKAKEAQANLEAMSLVINTKFREALIAIAPLLDRFATAILAIAEFFGPDVFDDSNVDHVRNRVEELTEELGVLIQRAQAAEDIGDFDALKGLEKRIQNINEQIRIMAARLQMLQHEGANVTAADFSDISREWQEPSKSDRKKTKKTGRSGGNLQDMLHDLLTRAAEGPSSAAADFERRKHEARQAYQQALDELNEDRIKKNKEALEEIKKQEEKAQEEIRDAWVNAIDHTVQQVQDIWLDSTKTTAEKIKATFINLAIDIANAFVAQKSGGKSTSIGAGIYDWISGGGGGSSGATPSGAGDQGGGLFPELGSWFSDIGDWLNFAPGGDMRAFQPSIVGEQGRELFLPKQDGKIVPHTQTEALLGGGGNTYVIDARGADVGAVARLERALLQYAGPGVVERRASAQIGRDMRRNMPNIQRRG